MRNDTIYLIVTVGKKGNSYTLRMRKPRSLSGNQYAYIFKIETDPDIWLQRFAGTLSLKPPPVPELLKIKSQDTVITPTDAERVFNTMKGVADNE